METLGPEQLRATMLAYRDALRAHQDRLNRLNVYPVPDGDTGTNMALTLESVVAALDGVDAGAVQKAVIHGSLMGARGNSGVILSQVLRGLAEGLGAADPVGAPGVAEALSGASRLADAAVMRPVEGTILTVARDAATAGERARDRSVVEVLEAAASAAAASLDRTPELLPVLAEAGVVDAGGAGFVLLIDALLHAADGRPLPPCDDDPSEAARPTVATAGSDEDDGHGPASEGQGGRYEVMYFLEAPDEAVEGFKQAWDAIGDSIVVVGGEGLWNCHVHTDDIGAAVEAGLDAGGRPRQIRVTDLHQQVADERRNRSQVTTAIVAVGAGEGIDDILRSLGVQEVVAGGQSMNPSTAQILDAIEATAADGVIVLPNNKNVVPVAEQAARLGTRKVHVVPTRSVAEGLASLLAYDPEVDVDTNVTAMLDAAAQVAWGEVTRAVRDAASTPAGPVQNGDWLGLDHGSIAVIEPDLAAAACGLLDRLVAESHEVVTVIEGDGSDRAVTARLTEWLAKHRPDAAVEVHHGGQPLAAYLFSAE
ncbi:MAG: Dihydroxyacetone kinase-like protein, phosphatase domain / Dihydroxyacetone kinase-like protein, kinase domain [uncultured Acidimicrobiales bacterium]|uniref:Dihydroxyacetone kinase-like protein, phosphatase domain / Dihydroxyacetone kinase-like protein, kinase domain n=1 Tax=uncultured Acidimicrobiales bacterium TaxID=310071 RepID=A0A6J4IFR0_9ACTN|nr:MAG: Dihydroxyacetone kinase-like protein, phosphatase domain / Dihydroxyacetone kinase-like protein, kinase domain [uncultured Acidimicrobiales bacterium]